MKTISNLAGHCAETESTAPAKSPSDVLNVQAQRGFQRLVRQVKGGYVLESTAGGQVLIPLDQMWALAEQHDPRLCCPK